jgi:hypothetical protein
MMERNALIRKLGKVSWHTTLQTSQSVCQPNRVPEQKLPTPRSRNLEKVLFSLSMKKLEGVLK